MKDEHDDLVVGFGYSLTKEWSDELADVISEEDSI